MPTLTEKEQEDIRRILEQHEPITAKHMETGLDFQFCRACRIIFGQAMPYPCPTAQGTRLVAHLRAVIEKLTGARPLGHEFVPAWGTATRDYCIVLVKDPKGDYTRDCGQPAAAHLPATEP